MEEKHAAKHRTKHKSGWYIYPYFRKGNTHSGFDMEKCTIKKLYINRHRYKIEEIRVQ